MAKLLYWKLGTIVSAISVQQRTWRSSSVGEGEVYLLQPFLRSRRDSPLRMANKTARQYGACRESRKKNGRDTSIKDRIKASRHDTCTLALFVGVHARTDRSRHVRSMQRVGLLLDIHTRELKET